MASEPSPYRILGTTGRSYTTAFPRRRKIKLPQVDGSREVTRSRHLFSPYKTENAKTFNLRYSEAHCCTRCGKPKFAVDGKPCKGRK